MNTWKTNLEETKKRYIDWWDHKGIILNMWEHFQEGVTPHADVPMPEPPRDLNQRWFDPEWRSRYLDWYVAHSCLKADILPVANTQLGPGSLAAILGGVLEGGEDTIWIHPSPAFSSGSTVPGGSSGSTMPGGSSGSTVLSGSAAEDIVFDRAHPNWLLHKELLRACKQRAQGHYYVGMPDLMEGLDVLAALKGTDRVLLDTVMQPEVLERQVQQVNDIYFQVFDELYDIIREGDEMAFCYFSSWAPGKMTKLQSDISTMISQDDYRRFVQPFIREQCQRIPYTLYHLDGVGAMHHLDALLEIDELNAIQWTPGVGQPQGGSPKWYDLYRKILSHGKSIMACWVTLDELRPLLDAIGTDGVHIEMDFHNEQEVEQAREIVERRKPSPDPAWQGGEWSLLLSDDLADRQVEDIINTVEQGAKLSTPLPQWEGPGEGLLGAGLGEGPLLLLDGAMGTMIQQYQLREEDFRGARFAQYPIDLKGCNDVLSLTAPFIVRDIHRKYLTAGADIIETNTFNAQRISLSDYGLQDHVRDINLAAARIARQCADEFCSSDKPRYVAGSIGPTSRTLVSEKVKSEESATATPSPHGTAEANSSLFTLHSSLKAAYEEQVQALADGGVDLLLIETIFDVDVARIAIEAAHTKAPQLPIMLSFSVSTPDGHNMMGQNIVDFLEEILNEEDEAKADHHIVSIGINCVTDVTAMTPLVKELACFCKCVSLYPNAGQPDANGHYTKTPESLLRDLWPLLEGHHLNIVGGCCGTTDQHIALMAKAIEPVKGIRLSGKKTQKTQQSQQAQSHHTPQTHPQPLPLREGSGHSQGGNATAELSTPLPQWEGPGVGLLFSAILNGNSSDAVAATQAAIAEGAEPQSLINEQMIGAMSEVGQRFQEGKAFVPQLLMAGRAMKAALQQLQPLMAGTERTSLGKVVIGTVKGDLHDIGKNLVASMLEGCGFEVVNIGIDVSADAFIEAVRQNQPDILCMSALLTTTMGYMKDVIDALQQAGIRQQVKVMVGGAPVTQRFADEIGADGYSDNANSAVTVAKQLLGVRSER